VEELLRAHQQAAEVMPGSRTETGQAVEHYVPAMIAETVARQLDMLDAEARRTAEMAAVIGPRFSYDLLRLLTRRAEGSLLVALRQLIGAYLIEEAAEGARDFVFRHALTRDAIYGRLLGPERQRLHRRIARALVAAGQSNAVPESELGYHAFLAEDWALALEHCRRAGERAQALYAPHAAVEHFSRALVAADRLGLPQTELLLHRGQAYEWAGDFERARADDERALASAHADGDSAREWRALIQLGTLRFGRNYAQSQSFYQRAHALALAAGDRAAVARSLISLGRWCQVVDWPDDALRYEAEALTIFTELGDDHGIAQTLERLGYASYFGADQTRSAAWHRQALARCEAMNDRRGLIMNLLGLAQCTATVASDWNAPGHTPISACLPDGERALELARASGWPYGEAHALTFLSFIVGAEGKYDEALSCARWGMAIGEEIEHRTTQIFAHCALGMLHLDLFALRTARQHLERALALARELHAPFYILSVTGLLVSLHLTEHNTAQAETIFAAEFSPDLPMRTHGQRRLWLARAEILLARGDPGGALDIIEEMIATTPNIERMPDGCIPRLDLTRSAALTALGRDEHAQRILETAIQTADAQGARPLLWRLQCALGSLHGRQGRTQEAARAFEAARLVIEDLAATVPDASTASMFQRQALGTIPHSYRTASYQAIKRQYGGLTAREREVVAQVARGLTNREIAERLFVTIKTVETHLIAAYRKLGIRSRDELADALVPVAG
jgi:DNA-binding CsgD family transcriptional regulator